MVRLKEYLLTANVPGLGGLKLGELGEGEGLEDKDRSYGSGWLIERKFLAHCLRICKAFWCALKKLFLWQNSVFVLIEPEMLPHVKNLRKFSADFNKQGLKWELITSPSYIKKIKFKILKFSQFFISKFLFSADIYVRFHHMRSHMKCYDTHYLCKSRNTWKSKRNLNYVEN